MLFMMHKHFLSLTFTAQCTFPFFILISVTEGGSVAMISPLVLMGIFKLLLLLLYTQSNIPLILTICH